MPNNDFDIRELPSWSYFAWGILNGLFLGISLKEGLDISETGILIQILDAFKPLFQYLNLSTGWITLSIILLGLMGIISTLIEIFAIYKKGWPARIIAICGFLSFLFFILGLDELGILLMVVGIIIILIFPNE